MKVQQSGIVRISINLPNGVIPLRMCRILLCSAFHPRSLVFIWKSVFGGRQCETRADWIFIYGFRTAITHSSPQDQQPADEDAAGSWLEVTFKVTVNVRPVSVFSVHVSIYINIYSQHHKYVDIDTMSSYCLLNHLNGSEWNHHDVFRRPSSLMWGSLSSSGEGWRS